MTRRTCAILALAAATALTLAAPASANHTLGHKLKTLTAKLNCLQRYPVFAFGDYAYYDLSDPSVPVMTSEETPQEVEVLRDNQEITALDFNYGPTIGQSDAFLLGVVQLLAPGRGLVPLAGGPFVQGDRLPLQITQR